MAVEWGSMRERGKAKRNDGKAPRNQAENALNARWWEYKEDRIPGAVIATLSHIREVQTSLELQRQICARLYGGTAPGSLYGINIDRVHMVHPSITGRLTYNVIAVVIDSLVSKITKNQVRPLFLTQGGDYRTQRRAKKLSQFAEGLFYETKFDALGPKIFRDGLVLGDGLVHVFEDPATHRVTMERVLNSEIYVDTIDGFYGEPTQMHRVKNVDKERLKVLAVKDDGKPDKEKLDMIIRAKPGGKDMFGGSPRYLVDSIGVVESWHLPSAPNAGDGVHAISIDTGCLLREPWKKPYFPFARFSWKPRIYGWHGAALAEELIGSQVEMNHLLIMMQRAFRMLAMLKIVVENGTVPDTHFNDQIGTILHVPHGSMKPEYITPPAMHPQYFQHFEGIKARAFEIARLSQLSAVGVKPAGLDSGEAQRVYHDIESEGFQYVGHAYEQLHLDVIQLALDVVRDIYERDGKYGLKAPVSSSGAPGVRFLRSIDWGDVNLPEDSYILRCYPISSLPDTPAGRLATVQELIRTGFVDEPTGRRLMNFPDLTQVMTLLGAAEDWIMKSLDAIIELDKESAEMDGPDGLMNLQLAETLCVQEIAMGAANDMEPWKLIMLHDWLSQVKYLQGKAATVQPMVAQPGQVASSQGVGVTPEMGAEGAPTGGAMQMPPGAMPQAVPGMPPQAAA